MFQATSAGASCVQRTLIHVTCRSYCLQKGLLGSFGQFWGKRVLPGGKAAVTALQLLSGRQSVQILALSKASLDCWQVNSASSLTTYTYTCHGIVPMS